MIYSVKVASLKSINLHAELSWSFSKSPFFVPVEIKIDNRVDDCSLKAREQKKAYFEFTDRVYAPPTTHSPMRILKRRLICSNNEYTINTTLWEGGTRTWTLGGVGWKTGEKLLVVTNTVVKTWETGVYFYPVWETSLMTVLSLSSRCNTS